MLRDDPPGGVIEADMVAVAEALGDRADALQGRTLLLTGAAGLLPSYMAETVAWLNRHRFSRPCRLLALVRSPIRPGNRLFHMRACYDVMFLEQDVRDPIAIDGPVDYIVHAASRASPRSYLADPLDTIDANTTATRRLLDLARLQKCASFLYFSSSEVYGDVPPDASPTAETHAGGLDSTAPRACYAESKRFGETLCAAYWRQHRVPVKMVRPFHVYGPGLAADDRRVVADFLRDRAADRPIRVLGDGRALRSFCYLADATVGFWLALLSRHEGEAFNIGDDREVVSVRELADIIAHLDFPAVPVELEAGDLPDHLRGSPSRACPDLSKARSLLGYRPTTDLREGLARTLDWSRQAHEVAR